MSSDMPTSAFGDSPGAWVYLGILVLCNAVVTLVIISLTGAFFQRCRHRRMVANLGKEQPAVVKVAHGSVTVLVPCYLPNEQHILKGTVTHIMENLEYPEPFLLILCYNTPKPLAAEQELLPALEATRWPHGRTLRVLKVEGSHSKAENLNACLPLITTETLVIYDADHHPDPPSLMFAAEMMRRKDCHCVQGSTYLRYKPTLLAKILDAEFFVIFFCFFPAVQVSPRLPDAPSEGATDGLRWPLMALMASDGTLLPERLPERLVAMPRAVPHAHGRLRRLQCAVEDGDAAQVHVSSRRADGGYRAVRACAPRRYQDPLLPREPLG